MKECDHEWILEFRDGPRDTNGWKCRKCGEHRTTHGPPIPPAKKTS